MKMTLITHNTYLNFIRAFRNSSFVESLVSVPIFLNVVLKGSWSGFAQCSGRLLISGAPFSCKL